MILAALASIAGLLLLIAVPEIRRHSALVVLEPTPSASIDPRDWLTIQSRLPGVLRNRLPAREQRRWFVRLTAAYLRQQHAGYSARLRELRQFPELETITIESGTVSAEDIQCLGAFRELKELKLSGLNMDHRALLELPRIARLERLIALGLAHRNLPGVVRRLPRLRVLEINADTLSPKAFGPLPALESLRLECSVLEGGVASIPSLPSLKRLEIWYPGILDRDVDALRRFPLLETLHLQSDNLSPACFPRLQSLPNLREAILPENLSLPSSIPGPKGPIQLKHPMLPLGRGREKGGSSRISVTQYRAVMSGSAAI